MSFTIDSLFRRNRFLSGPTLLFVIIYAPLGIVVFTLRLFISLQLCLASLVLPSGTLIRRFVLRILYAVMGVIVREKDIEKKDEKCNIVISNHVTPFDNLAVSLVHSCVSVNVYNLPAPLSFILSYKDFGVTRERGAFKNNVISYLNSPGAIPLLLYPEGSSTNGSVALMKYGTWALEFDSSVLVIGLQVHRIPLIPISPSVLGSSWLADLFYLLFSPISIYTIRYIGKMKRTESESLSEFASRIQKATASALNLQTSNYDVSDKVEYVKRLAREDTVASNPFFNPEIHSMALQVKEVLPYLPLDIIKRDIIRTRNVDVTITNFLEGNIPEPIPTTPIPEPITTSLTDTSPQSLSDTSSSSSRSPSISSTPRTSNDSADLFASKNITGRFENFNTAAKSFGTNAQERMLSFHERKANLIAMARQRYIQKHNLKIKSGEESNC